MVVTGKMNLHMFPTMQGTYGDIKKAGCDALGLEEVDVRLWDFFNRKKYGQYSLDSKLDESLESGSSASMIDGQDILLEEKASRHS